MTDRINNNFGGSYNNFGTEKKVRERTPDDGNSKSFGNFLVDDSDEDISPEADTGSDETSESDSSLPNNFGSIFGSIRGSRGNDYEDDNRGGSNRNSSNSRRTTYTHKPEHEEKPKHKPENKFDHKIEKDAKSDNDQPLKLKEIQPTDPLAAFHVPMQMDKMPMQVNAVEKAAPATMTEQIDQIVQDVRLGINAMGLAEFQFDLKSDTLDGLKLKISTKDGQVHASFIAENVHVKDALDQTTQELVKALQARGLEVANINVSVGADTSGNGQGQQQQGQQQSNSGGGNQRQSQSDDYYGSDSSEDRISSDIRRSNTDYTL